MRRAILFLSISLGTVFANPNDTSTGIDLDKLPHFPLTKLRSGWLKPGTRVTFDGISAVASDGNVRLSGTGKSGKRWEVNLFWLDEVWRGDLDGNGTADYVFFGLGPYGNGRTAPSFSLSILLMDPKGMPVPFFTVVYKGEKGDGIKHLLDLNRDGNAELLISDYDELPSDAHVGPFCSGHWVSQLYRFRNYGAEEIRGTIAGIRFPIVYNWRYRAFDCADQPKPFSRVETPVPHSHRTSGAGFATTLRSRSDENGFVAIRPIEGCKTISANVVLYDTPRLRTIAFPNLHDDYQQRLIHRIWAGRAHVELRGINKEEPGGTCAVNLLWAR